MVAEENMVQSVAADGGCGRTKKEEENLHGERIDDCWG